MILVLSVADGALLLHRARLSRTDATVGQRFLA
jgi:hypothetical protein